MKEWKIIKESDFILYTGINTSAGSFISYSGTSGGGVGGAGGGGVGGGGGGGR